jgi:hypothetical protein
MNECPASLNLGINRVEFLVKPLIGRDPGIDGASLNEFDVIHVG